MVQWRLSVRPIQAQASSAGGTGGQAMHTDEYEISLGREIVLCRKMVRQLQASLERREQHCGMGTEGFLEALQGGCLAGEHQGWSREYQELQTWQKRLAAYEEALESLKWL
jgi:hypothetical protein